MNKKVKRIKAARQAISDEFKKDPEFRMTYKANIAMKIWDMSVIKKKTRLSRTKCNEIADELIDLIFNS